MLEVDDLISVTTLKSDEAGDESYNTTWTEDTDFVLMPQNTTPKRWVRLHPTGNYSWPSHTDAIEIVGSFGYAATLPARVREFVLRDAMAVFLASSSTTTTGGESDPITRPPLSDLDSFRRMDVRS